MQTPEATARPSVWVRQASLHLRNVVSLSETFERALARELSINATDLEAMEHLIKDGPLSPSEIARRLGISPASVSIAIDRLTTLGHVSRTPNPDDRRSVLVSATVESRKRAMDLLLPIMRSIDGVLDEFDTDEQALITRYLGKIEEQYQHHVNRIGGSPEGVAPETTRP